MIFSKLIEYYKWFRIKFPTLKQIEKMQLEEKLKVDKELKQKKDNNIWVEEWEWWSGLDFIKTQTTNH